MTYILAVVVTSVALLISPSLNAAAWASSVEEAQGKLQSDLKTAVLDGAITAPQLRELQSSVDKLEAYREAQRPGMPVDLLTPFRATSTINQVFSNTDVAHRKTLQEDFRALLVAQDTQASASNPNPDPGEKLGKDIFRAVTFDRPSEHQVQQLQDSLNALQELKRNHGRPVQALMRFRESKSQIAAVLGSPAFSPEAKSLSKLT